MSGDIRTHFCLNIWCAVPFLSIFCISVLYLAYAIYLPKQTQGVKTAKIKKNKQKTIEMKKVTKEKTRK
jgi:hypothetical protein